MATVTFSRNFTDAAGNIYRPGDTAEVDDARAKRLADIGVSTGVSDIPWTDPAQTPARNAKHAQWVKYVALVAPGVDAASMSKADLIEQYGEPVGNS